MANKNSNHIAILDGQDEVTLEKQGWFFVTYYQTQQQVNESSAHRKAFDKALSHERRAGIRSFVKDDVTYWEIWEQW